MLFTSYSRSRLLVCILLLSGSVLLLLQSPMAPFANKLVWTDSGVFIYSATEIMAGKTMYLDLFDHKGPVIYLLNIIGLSLLRGNLTGIWLLELTAVYSAALLLYRTARLFAGRFTAFCCSIYMLIALIPVLEQGNLTEEYALPFIAYATYRFCIFFTSGNIFRFRDVFGLSFCCGLTFLLRANMIAAWMGFGLVAAFVLVTQQRWKDLGTYGLWALAGLAAAFLPFLLYFLATGALSAFWQCFWTFNHLYSSPSATKAATGILGIVSIIAGTHLLLLFSGYLLYLLFCYRREVPAKQLHRALILSFLLTLVICCGWSGNTFAHYAMSCMPLSFFSVFLFRLSAGKVWHSTFLTLLILLLSWPLIPRQITYIRNTHDKKPAVRRVAAIIAAHTHPGDQIIVLGNNCKFYFMTRTHSCSRYFFQFPIAYADPSIIPAVIRDIIRNKPILILEQVLIDDPELQQFMQQFYVRHEEAGEIFYFRK